MAITTTATKEILLQLQKKFIYNLYKILKEEYLQIILYLDIDKSFGCVLRHFVIWDKVPFTIGHSKSSILQNKGNKSILLKGSNLHPDKKAGPLAKKNGCISATSLL